MNEEEQDEYERRAYLAGRLAKRGQVEEAEEILRQIPDSQEWSDWFHEKTASFSMLADAYAVRGEGDKALTVGREAVAMARVLGTDVTSHEARVLLEVGFTMLTLGAREEGVATWRRAVELCAANQLLDAASGAEEDTGIILSKIAVKLAELGLAREAESVANRIRWDRLRVKTLSDLGELERRQINLRANSGEEGGEETS